MPYLNRRASTFSLSKFCRATLMLVFALGLVSLAPAKVSKKSPAALPPNPYDEGKWTVAFNLGTVVHASVLPSGKVLYWSQFSFPPTYTRLWCGGSALPGCTDTSTPADVWYNDTYLFCAGHSLTQDGKVLITGGSMFDQPLDGTPKTTLYDPTTNAFSSGPNMAYGRWYPTNVILGNGETLTASGTYCSRHPNPWVADCPRGFLFNNVPDVLNSSGTGLRSLTGATDQIPLYPWLHLAKDGRVFNAGPNPPSRWLNTAGVGAWGGTPKSYSVPVPTREGGSSVMYDVDKVLIAGGHDDPPTNTSETIDLTNEIGNWTQTANPMHSARRHLNLTLLADGTVLATGGSSGSGFNNTCAKYAVKEAEIWTPGGLWQPMAAATHARFYHSTALLLIDGRVLVGGSTPWNPVNDPCHVDAEYENEIFWPPYLFNPDGTNATRPTISSAPTDVSYGSQFQVNTPNGLSITNVTMVRLSSVTHSVNMNQRINHLTFSHVGAGLRVNAPANGNVCPPGHYMLFIISDRVPSIAKIVHIS